MLRSLLITTASIALMTSVSVAADSDTNAQEQNTQVEAGATYSPSQEHILATNLVGTSVFRGQGDDAERIGEVSDVIVSREGNVEAVIVDVGGFLGIGEKTVALDYEHVEWSRDQDGRPRMTVAIERQALDNAEEFDPGSLRAEMENGQQGARQDTMNSEQDASERVAADEAGDQPAEVDERMAAEQPVGENQQAGDQRSWRENLEVAATAELRADDIIGATVYGANDENIGEVGDIILSDKEKIEAYIVEIGGFLGLGEKPVAISASDFDVMSDGNGNLYIFTPFTSEQLDGHPAYNEAEYRENPDESVLTGQK